MENVTSSPSNGVIGASLFKNNAPQKPKEVLLTFRIQNDTLNITGNFAKSNFLSKFCLNCIL